VEGEEGVKRALVRDCRDERQKPSFGGIGSAGLMRSGNGGLHAGSRPLKDLHLFTVSSGFLSIVHAEAVGSMSQLVQPMPELLSSLMSIALSQLTLSSIFVLNMSSQVAACRANSTERKVEFSACTLPSTMPPKNVV
jgi:hypothetical protein